MPLTPTIEAEFSAGVWTDISADVLWRDPIRMRRGIFGSGVFDRVAPPGSLSFTLNNSVTNSGATNGYYSPGHASVRAGFTYGTRVRLKLTDGTNTRYKTMAKLTDIRPDPGATGPRGTVCLAIDKMDDLASLDADELSLQESQRSDQLITAILALLDTAFATTTLDVGKDTYPFAFDDLGDAPKALALIHRICESELGFFATLGNATNGETARFFNREARAVATNAATLVASDLRFDDGIIVPSSLDRIINEALVEVNPRRVDAAATTVLFSLDNTPAIAAGETLTFWLTYRDPLQEAVFVGIKNGVAPVATTDYTANTLADGTGTNLTADLTVTATFFGSVAKVVVTLGGSAAGFVTKLEGRGKGLYRYQAIMSRGQNAASITANGTRPLPSPLNMIYQDDRNIGQGAADYIVNVYGSLGNVPEAVRFSADKSAALLAHGILREIGDKITVTEGQTGVTAITAFINAIDLEITAKDHMVVQWILASADTTNVFILDDAVAGVLDTGQLGYF